MKQLTNNRTVSYEWTKGNRASLVTRAVCLMVCCVLLILITGCGNTNSVGPEVSVAETATESPVQISDVTGQPGGTIAEVAADNAESDAEVAPDNAESETSISPYSGDGQTEVSDDEVSEAPTPSASGSVPSDTTNPSANSDHQPEKSPQISVEIHTDRGEEAAAALPPSPSVETKPDEGDLIDPSTGDKNDGDIDTKNTITVKVVGPEDELVFITTVDSEDIDTAFDALKLACEEESVELEYTGFGSFVYVSSIGGYKERSEGPLSGWIYKVNGETASKGCNVFKVYSGDSISFYFTVDLGKDVADKD